MWTPYAKRRQTKSRAPQRNPRDRTALISEGQVPEIKTFGFPGRCDRKSLLHRAPGPQFVSKVLQAFRRDVDRPFGNGCGSRRPKFNRSCNAGAAQADCRSTRDVPRTRRRRDHHAFARGKINGFKQRRDRRAALVCNCRQPQRRENVGVRHPRACGQTSNRPLAKLRAVGLGSPRHLTEHLLATGLPYGWADVV
jgi:hypothetical protein